MDLKKHSFSDQFPYCVSPPRKKVVSGFGLGIFASFIVLTVILFSVPFKTPFLNPIFQGFNSSGSSNTSLLSSPFSFSSITGFSSSNTNTSSSSTTTTITTELQNVNLMDRDRVANLSEIGKDRKSLDSNGKGIVIDKTHVGNFSDKDKNGSFTVDQERTQMDDGSEIGKVVKFSSSNFKGIGLEKTHLGNLSENVENGSYGYGNVTAEKNGFEVKILEKIANASSLNANIRASELKNEETNDTITQYQSPFSKMQSGAYEECDIFDGRWVRSDDSKPYYPGSSCPYIDRDFDCHLNGRPDDGFLRWKWQPYGCDIPSLNATDFLERLRGKKLVFVGDSLNRNMWESLVCILRHNVKNKKRVYEISGRHEFKKKGFYAFRFEDYNCSVDFVSAPFLVKESSFKSINGTLETLRLDLMDRTTSMYHDADVIVFNTGHWWTHEKTSRGEDYYQEGNHVHQRLKVLEAYKRALTTWARWVDQNIDGSRTQVIFRGYSVTHFRRGEWNSGGQCHKETEPFFNQSYLAKYPSKMRALEHVLREMKTPVIYMNISRLTGYRKDGHPSIYRMETKSVAEQNAAGHSQDCSHWCLPGVPDTWNQLLYASLLKVGIGSWKI